MRRVIILLFLMNLSIYSSSQTPPKDNTFEYLVGQRNMAEYSLDVCWYTLPKNVKLVKFSNGMSAPILQAYVINKSKFIGGKLENTSGLQTEIVDIKLMETPKTLIFNVMGKSFNMGFVLEKGALLKEEENYTTFYTEGVGIWKIYKK